MNFIEAIKELDDLVEAYHSRNGTFNFHYDSFELKQWKVWLSQEMKKEDYERMDVTDYAVTIFWSDNSLSLDSYTVPLNDIIEWGENHVSIG